VVAGMFGLSSARVLFYLGVFGVLAVDFSYVGELSGLAEGGFDLDSWFEDGSLVYAFTTWFISPRRYHSAYLCLCGI